MNDNNNKKRMDGVCASDNGVGVVVTQLDHRIAYLSKALGVKTQALPTYEKRVYVWQCCYSHR
jgi:hypothetical protein